MARAKVIICCSQCAVCTSRVHFVFARRVCSFCYFCIGKDMFRFVIFSVAVSSASFVRFVVVFGFFRRDFFRFLSSFVGFLRQFSKISFSAYLIGVRHRRNYETFLFVLKEFFNCSLFGQMFLCFLRSHSPS